MSQTSIKGIIQQICSGEISLVSGKVIAINPLSVRVQDDVGLTIGSALLIVPEHLREKKTSIKIAGEEKKITINEALAVGDLVTLLSVNRGQMYYILGRE